VSGGNRTRIRAEGLSAEIDPQGAQLSALRDADGRDLLWSGDPAFWSGRAPLLFPIVGALNGGHYRIDGRSYPLPRHGFARGRAFEVLRAAESAAVFRLAADEASRALYPFDFVLDVEYAVSGAALAVTTWIRNRGATEMLASFGHHPAFLWPLPYGRARAEHRIEFDADEPAAIRRLDADGLLEAGGRPTPVRARRLMLSDDLFKEDVVIFDRLNSRSLVYGAGDGPRLRVSFPDSPYLGLWTKAGAPFICIEPWHGVADPAGFAGELRDKPGICAIAPGGEFRTTMAVSLIAA
jgi:galactose mutarotase-like enzyme